MKILFLGQSEDNPVFKWLSSREKTVFRSEKISLDYVKKILPEFTVSYGYRHIIKKDVLDFLASKIINLHISYLPYNKGAHPNLFSVLEDTPKGISIHVIDDGIDTGSILVKKEVKLDLEAETLKSSYEKLHGEMEDLFKVSWEKIKSGKIKPKPQVGDGTIHYVKDFKKIEPLLNEFGWDTKLGNLKRKYNKKVNNLLK